MVGTAVDTDSDPQNGATRENRGAISDQELAGRGLIADRLQDEVEWLRECARWLAQLDLGIFVGTLRRRRGGLPPQGTTSTRRRT